MCQKSQFLITFLDAVLENTGCTMYFSVFLIHFKNEARISTDRISTATQQRIRKCCLTHQALNQALNPPTQSTHLIHPPTSQLIFSNYTNKKFAKKIGVHFHSMGIPMRHQFDPNPGTLLPAPYEN